MPEHIDVFSNDGKPLLGQDLFTYSFTFPALAPNGPGTDSINIENDSDFLWMKSTYYATVDTTSAVTQESRVVPFVTFNWKNTATGRSLFNVPMPVSSFWGRGEIPMILPVKKLLRGKSTLTVDLTNLHTVQTYNLTLSMIGVKIFKRG